MHRLVPDLDLTSTIMRQLLARDLADLARVPAGCARYSLAVCMIMDEDDELGELPPEVRYDPRRDCVFAPTAAALCAGALECMRRLGRADARLERALHDTMNCGTARAPGRTVPISSSTIQSSLDKS